MKELKIERAQLHEAAELTSISLAAKSYWQYPTDWIELWKEDLTITEPYIAQHPVFTLKNDNELMGFCAFELQEQILEVSHMWIRPEFMGQGLGKGLLTEALQRVSSLYSFRRIRVVSDPNAKEFYQKLGFTQVAVVESEPAGRLIPVLEKEEKYFA